MILFVQRGCMICFFVPSDCIIFLSREVARYFCPERLRVFSPPERLRDILSREVT